MANDFKLIDNITKQRLMADPELHTFLTPVFAEEPERRVFIKRCLRKNKTRRMLLHAQDYLEMADDQRQTRHTEPALSLIFLMAMSESLAKTRMGNKKFGSAAAARSFFKYILPADKQSLKQKFRRALLSAQHHELRFSSILKILYENRNKAVHGDDYFIFQLMDESTRVEYESGNYTHFGQLTHVTLVSKSKKRKRVTIDLILTYEELRDIFRRTAIENIKQNL